MHVYSEMIIFSEIWLYVQVVVGNDSWVIYTQNKTYTIVAESKNILILGPCVGKIIDMEVFTLLNLVLRVGCE